MTSKKKKLSPYFQPLACCRVKIVVLLSPPPAKCGHVEGAELQVELGVAPDRGGRGLGDDDQREQHRDYKVSLFR